MIVSIDPGIRHCGVAIWTKAGAPWVLYKAGLVVSPYTGKNQLEAARSMAVEVAKYVNATGWSLEELVIERPQVIRGWTKNAGSITALSITVGALAAAVASNSDPATLSPLPTLVEYLPVQQKGNVPKPIMEDRTRARLSLVEMAAVSLPKRGNKISMSLAHNVFDSIWLGLQHLGRGSK